MTAIKTIAVVGAGVAGLAAAEALTRAGASVTLFDKGRRPGGRVATRRAGAHAFNHGAQFATARGPAFQAVLAGLQAAGKAAPWPEAGARAWVGLPGMSALTTAMAEAAGAAMQLDRHVAFLRRDDAGWMLRHLPSAEARPGQVIDAGALAGPFDAVLLALPAPQATPLFAALGHGFAAETAKAVLAPCWAVMAGYAAPVAGPGVLRPGLGPIAWAAREASRPGSEGGEAWTLHASPAWTRAHLEDSTESVAAALGAAFSALTGAPAPASAVAHRWRHALVETPLGVPCLWDAQSRIGACGDWCLDRRVEAAFDSGQALAARVRESTVLAGAALPGA